MEDAHICTPSLAGYHYSWRNAGLFGVFDGHGGEQVAKYCSIHLSEELCASPLSLSKQVVKGELETALRNAFHRMDDRLRDPRTSEELKSLTNPSTSSADRFTAGVVKRTIDAFSVGCTACVCCITPLQLIVANAGDSRAVLCRNGKAIALSEDHKPNNTIEKRRIEAAGGYVEYCGPGQYRVNGNLNLSRAIGDLEYKRDLHHKPEEQIICSTPDVTFSDRHELDEFLLICCDGVWDVKTNQQAVDFIRAKLPPSGRAVDKKDLTETLECLLDDCVSPDLNKTQGLGGDNMTAVLVMLSCTAEQATLMQNGSGGNPDATHQMMRRTLDLKPTLSSVKKVDLTSNRGILQIHISLWAGLDVQDVSAGLSEDDSKIEVIARILGLGSSLAGTQIVEVFDLDRHVPKGAKLTAQRSAKGQPARFSRRSGSLRLCLSWQML